MKNIAVTLLFYLLGCHSLVAQFWDDNTSWVFETVEYGPAVDGNYLIHKVNGDTIIQETSFYRLSAFYRVIGESELKPDPGLDIYFQYEDDQVYYFDPCDNSINLVYDFSLEAGDTLTSYCSCNNGTFQVRIDSVDLIVRNGVERKRQFTSYVNGENCDMVGVIIEGLGFSNYLLPQLTFQDPPLGGKIVCYSDVTFSYPESTSDCSLIVSNQEQITETINVFPNPVIDIVRLEGVNDANFKIFNSLGAIQYRGHTSDGVIDVSVLSAGAYIMILSTDDRQYMARLVKME